MKEANQNKGIFIGGTGTGVGKTIFSLMLISYLEEKGINVAPMKPAETGCNPAPVDALSLMAVANKIYSIEDVCPFRFSMPAAPEAAAIKENIKIDIKKIQSAFNKLASLSDLVVVEGAGAIATPYWKNLTGIEIARKLNIPVILVTSEKLGTVGQTLSCVRALKASKVKCMGIIISETNPNDGSAHLSTNESLIKSHTRNVSFIATLPYMDLKWKSVENTPCSLWKEWTRKNMNIFSNRIGRFLDTESFITTLK